MNVTQSGDERRIAAGLTIGLIERFPRAIDDPAFLDAALRDLFGDGLRRERALLIAAARAGVPQRALAGALAENEALDFDPNPADARWSVETWFEVSAKLRFARQAALTQPYSPALVPQQPPKARRPRRLGPLAAAVALCALTGGGLLALRAHAHDDTIALAPPGSAPTASAAPPSPAATFDWTKLLPTDAPQPRPTEKPVALATLEPTDAPDTPSPEPVSTGAPVTLPESTDQPESAGTASPGSANQVPARHFDLDPGEDLTSAPNALAECIGDWKAHRWDDAKSSCREAAQADPNDAEPELLLGESYYGCACYSGAIAPLTAALRLASTDDQKLEAYRYRGYVDYELWTGDGDESELEDALADFGGALDIDGDDPTTLYDYGAAAYKLGHWCKAEDAFSTLAQRYPEDRDSEYWWRMSANNHEQYGCT